MASETTTEGTSQTNYRNANIKVKLTFKNEIKEPYFERVIKLENVIQRQLVFMLMLDAGTVDPTFRFSMSYYGPELGMMIDSIYGVTSKWDPDRTYWKILGKDETALKVGCSSFTPENEDEIIFEFVKSDGDCTD